MFTTEYKKKVDFGLLIPGLVLLTIGLFILISLKYITPPYFLFVVFGIFLYFFFANIDFDVLEIFSKYFYIASVILLLLPIVIGTATRGTIRWVSIAGFTLQPAELVRPFLFVFLAVYFNSGKKTFGRFITGSLLFAIPTFLILIQPSLGVTLITISGFIGIFLASNFPKKYYLSTLVFIFLALPVGWWILADYQKARIFTFIHPAGDPQGSGYNSIQAMISVGSGRLFGRGLGRGVQTQLSFLPERQSDFVFASICEELGLLGAVVVLSTTYYLLQRLLNVISNSKDLTARAFVAGLFLSLFVQIVVHVGMNVGLLPVTGVPYPFVSAAGSSLVATLAGLGIVSSIKNSSKGV